MTQDKDTVEKFINANALKFAYTLYGEPDAPVILLISGLGHQMFSWSDEFCHKLVDAGFRVLRFDNRDVGLSSELNKFTPSIIRLLMSRFFNTSVSVPYRLEDMVEDSVGLLNQLQIGRVHIVGFEMGGWIAQRIAIQYPERILSMTNISSSIGFGQHIRNKWRILLSFFKWANAKPSNLHKRIINMMKIMTGSLKLNKDMLEQSEVYLSRHGHPNGIKRQLASCFSSIPQNISDSLKKLSIASLVIHGKNNPWISEHDAKTLATTIPGSTLAFLDQMEHYISDQYIAQVTDWIILHTKTSEMRPISSEFNKTDKKQAMKSSQIDKIIVKNIKVSKVDKKNTVKEKKMIKNEKDLSNKVVNIKEKKPMSMKVTKSKIKTNIDIKPAKKVVTKKTPAKKVDDVEVDVVSTKKIVKKRTKAKEDTLV
ncbi:MAG: alpha/beta fold hydrolase [Endozoicomonadaceae bacterium]|nr:alpha/beta fold hydrolase [Endozoicomonadaceae bacterium]